MDQFYDVVIVGGGPAGASAAIHLAQGGARVLLAEARQFPRAKLCGEFISPECLAHFAKLGVLDEMLAAGGASLLETVFYARSGAAVSVPSAWFGDSTLRNFSGALGLSRAEMDARLLHRARAAGTDVLEEASASDLIFDDSFAARGVRLKTAHGAGEVCGRIVIDATGRARALVRRVEQYEKLKRNHQRASRQTSNFKMPKKRAALVAFKAHLTDAAPASSVCEIYFYRGGYGGLSAVENDLSNFCFIVRSEDARALNFETARDLTARAAEHKAETLMREIVCQNRRAAETLRSARAVTDWQAVSIESFGRAALVPAKNLLTIGDAAAFVDPFTGSGMLMALESGELAAQAIHDWLASAHRKRDEPPPFALLARDYERRYAQKFDARLRLCAWLRRAALAPERTIEAATKVLNMNARLRRQLARATRRATF
jgi:flavin-dependent dehydrogenase